MVQCSSNGESNNAVLLNGKLITRQQFEEQYGKKREDAAATLGVSVSTFMRKKKEIGINKWPYPKRCSKSKSCVRIDDEDDDDVDASTDESVLQPSLRTSTQTLNSFSRIEDIKFSFDRLIMLPLEDLSEPENESSMEKALSILADNLYLFSKEQAEQILGLLFNFPALVHSWREYSRSQMCSQKSSAEMENTRDLVKTSVEDKESLKVRYKQLKNKKKELMIQLEAVEKDEAEIAQRISLVKKKEAQRNKEEVLMRITTSKLNNLPEQWNKLRSSFI